jgi:hypothetical protein
MASLPPIGSSPVDSIAQSLGAPQYLPNLTAIIDDTSGAYGDGQKSIATEQRNLREYAAFGRLEPGAQVLGDYRAYYQAYLNYTSQLSPAERADPRYANVIPQVQAALAAADKAAQKQSQQIDPNTATLFASTQIEPLGPPAPLGSQSPLPTPDMISSLGQLNQLFIAEESGAKISRTQLGLPELATPTTTTNAPPAVDILA